MNKQENELQKKSCENCKWRGDIIARRTGHINDVEWFQGNVHRCKKTGENINPRPIITGGNLSRPLCKDWEGINSQE